MVDTSPLTPQELTVGEGGRQSPVPSSGGADWRAVMPVPDDAPPAPVDMVSLGKPWRTWAYRDRLGRLLFYMQRFNLTNGSKEFQPLAYFEHRRGVRRWRHKGVPSPYPLYGLQDLAAHPEAQVLVVEGEKTADAARVLFPEMVVTTSPFGSNAASKADWSPLAGRVVVVWPDHDAAGHTYGAAVAHFALTAGAASVKIVEVS
ncbi:MAG: DUF6371 domain-containing protein [Thermoanaerobaculales bacterium]